MLTAADSATCRAKGPHTKSTSARHVGRSRLLGRRMRPAPFRRGPGQMALNLQLLGPIPDEDRWGRITTRLAGGFRGPSCQFRSTSCGVRPLPRIACRGRRTRRSAGGALLRRCEQFADYGGWKLGWFQERGVAYAMIPSLLSRIARRALEMCRPGCPPGNSQVFVEAANAHEGACPSMSLRARSSIGVELHHSNAESQHHFVRPSGDVGVRSSMMVVIRCPSNSTRDRRGPCGIDVGVVNEFMGERPSFVGFECVDGWVKGAVGL